MAKQNKGDADFSVSNRREILVAQLHQAAGVSGVIAPAKTLQPTAKVKFYWNGTHVEWEAGDRSGLMPYVNFISMEFKD